ncbi:unnamed protein product, partial [Mesorhabditis belari]|uniref:BPTI/Kunitz inhibitor domain-containing protein n=1 Tax=Mesorhabditis belari TaxID=2138241 RepID=A0AAF3FKS0_9BILA
MDSECSNGRKCQPTGQTHFGTSVGYCCLTKAQRCSLQINPGYGDCFKPSVQRFYFDPIELRCKSFMFVDCVGGNDNRFETLQECQRFCENTACNDGETVQMVQGNVKVCNVEAQDCPNGFHCAYDVLFRKHVCCGHPKRETCPSGHLAYLEPGSQTVRTCQPTTVSDNCPSDFFCVSQGPIGYCCTPEKDVCPLGQKAYLHPVSGKSLKCDPLLSPSTCPTKHYCVATVPGARWGACCDEKLTPTCPENTKPYLDSISQQPVICTVGVTSCNDGYLCQGLHPSDLIGFCCTFAPKFTQQILTEMQTHQISRNSTEALETTTPKPTTTKSRAKNPIFLSQHESVHTLRNSMENSVFEEEIPMKRIIDLQKEIDAETSRETKPSFPIVSATVRPQHVHQPFKYLECPGDSLPVFYPGTQLLMECSPTINRGFECPENSECVLAQNDLFGRSVCCSPAEVPTTELYFERTTPLSRILMPDSEESLEYGRNTFGQYGQFVYTVTLKAPDVDTERTLDPFCPRIVRNRKCSPGGHDACPEYKFYCQYNIQFRDFRCCSLESNYRKS